GSRMWNHLAEWTSPMRTFSSEKVAFWRCQLTSALVRAIVCGGVPAVLLTAIQASPVRAESIRTANFEVTADTPEIARLVAHQAEALRSEFSRDWLGTDLPVWMQPCTVHVDTTHSILSGDTSYFLS